MLSEIINGIIVGQVEADIGVELTPVGLVVSASVYVVILCGAAYMMKSSVTDKRTPFPQPQMVPLQYSMAGKDFAHDTFSCTEDSQACLGGCFCFACRLADIFTTVGVASFWEVIGVWLAGYLLNLLILLVLPVLNGIPGIILLVYLTLRRGQLRTKFGGQPNLLMDCLCMWCCLWCSTCQMIRQVDGAAGVEVVSCLTLRTKPQQGPPVGQPMQAGMPGGGPMQAGMPGGVPMMQQPM